MPARRFEFQEGSSAKFWAIERNAREVTVTFGRIGSTGQEKTKAFPSEAKATLEEEKLIAEKVRKGYREAQGGEAQDEDEDDSEPIPPPPGFSKPTTWDAIAKACTAPAGARKRTPVRVKKYGANDLKGVAKALGIRRFPPSYLVYLERFMQLGELEQRYQRKGFTYFLNIHSPDILEEQGVHFREFIDRFVGDYTAKAQKIMTAAKKLIPFGSNTSRTDICWDPSQTTPAGEMAICFFDHDAVQRTNAGQDLKEVLKYYRPHYR